MVRFMPLTLGLLLAYLLIQVIMRRAKKKLELTCNVIGRDDADLETHGPASAVSTDLRSMIMFGINTLHSSDATQDTEVGRSSELERIVEAALNQRGKAGPGLSNATEFGNVELVTLDAQDDGAENFYNYEGKDFAKVRNCEGCWLDLGTNVSWFFLPSYVYLRFLRILISRELIHSVIFQLYFMMLFAHSNQGLFGTSMILSIVVDSSLQQMHMYPKFIVPQLLY